MQWGAEYLGTKSLSILLTVAEVPRFCVFFSPTK